MAAYNWCETREDPEREYNKKFQPKCAKIYYYCCGKFDQKN